MTFLRREFLLALAGSSALTAKPHAEIALAGGKVYPSPSAQPFQKGVVVLRDGRVSAVGPVTKTRIPPKALVVDCRTRVVLAGFANSHVHFSEPHWTPAATLPAASLSAYFQNMLTRWGYTSVFDTGSDSQNTLALIRRIEAGEIPGPAIRRAGGGFVKKDGTPSYLKDTRRLPELLTAEQATIAVREVLEQGADAIKIFAGSAGVAGPALSLEIIRAVTAEAHRQQKLVFSHPQHREGVMNSVLGGVDILAHTAPRSGVWDQDLVRQMVERHMSLIPTLHLFEVEFRRLGRPPEEQRTLVQAAKDQLTAFAQAGGDVLFGTDVGYMTDYDPTREYQLMAEAGLTPAQILASLTTNPATRFADSRSRGQLAPGFLGDVVVLKGDPFDDVRNFAQVQLCMRQGKVLFRSN
ncbi:MAG: amidohydrolase family protein [Bryobacteraceae bacterium]